MHEPTSDGAGGKTFRGSVVCVAGASRGIGKAVAQAFAERGARLLLLARSDKLMETNEELRATAETVAVRCDLTDWPRVREAMDQAVLRWGGMDVLVNTAAELGPTGNLWTVDPEEWTRTISTNLNGVLHAMRAALSHMIAARKGKIINFAGGGAAYGYPNFSAYAASKAAVVRLTETVALECLPYNVQVNVIAPGAIETALLAQVRAAGGEVRTAGRMEDAVNLVLFLASRQSDGVSSRFIHTRDDYRAFPSSMPADLYTLRRVEP